MKYNLEGIICFGYAGASPGLMNLCCERGVALSFLTEHGRFIGRVTGRVSGNILLRRAQYRWTECESMATRLAKRFVSAKIINSRANLHRALRDHPESINNELLTSLIGQLADMHKQLENACNVETVRGIEGHSAHLYFNGFNQLILMHKDKFEITGRNKRPPIDRTNAMLSFLYTLLAHDVAAALESIGLDPQAGFLHKDRPGRLSMALDLMEELRPHFADRLAITLINRGQVSPEGFTVKENGAVLMDGDTRKIIITAWQKRKQEEIVHPYLEEKITLGLVPYVQSMLLARHIRGDLEDYPPFYWK
jgi:CRISPR-associated protein Cas1